MADVYTQEEVGHLFNRLAARLNAQVVQMEYGWQESGRGDPGVVAPVALALHLVAEELRGLAEEVWDGHDMEGLDVEYLQDDPEVELEDDEETDG